MFLLTVFLVTMLFSRCYCNLTLFSVQFYSYLNSRRFFLFNSFSTFPVCIYSCCLYLYGCFSGHVFFSTSNIETNSVHEHCSCIVACAWHYAVSSEPFSMVFSTLAREFCSISVKLSVYGLLASLASVHHKIDTFARIQQQQ